MAGIPSVFIRTSGCNLRCLWCDTPYTSWKPAGKEWSVDEILNEIRPHPTRFAVVTGGEPLLSPDIIELTKKLKQKKYHVTIETDATIFKRVACDLVSMSPKLANSTPWKKEGGKFAPMHENHRLNLAVIQKFINLYDYQLKFVVEKKKDFEEIEGILKRLKGTTPAKILLMAQARTKRELREKAPWIAALCKAHDFRYTPRLQIELYGNRRGT